MALRSWSSPSSSWSIGVSSTWSLCWRPRGLRASRSALVVRALRVVDDGCGFAKRWEMICAINFQIYCKWLTDLKFSMDIWTWRLPLEENMFFLECNCNVCLRCVCCWYVMQYDYGHLRKTRSLKSSRLHSKNKLIHWHGDFGGSVVVRHTHTHPQK